MMRFSLMTLRSVLLVALLLTSSAWPVAAAAGKPSGRRVGSQVRCVQKAYAKSKPKMANAQLAQSILAFRGWRLLFVRTTAQTASHTYLLLCFTR